MRYRHWETCPCCCEGPRAAWTRRKFFTLAGAAAVGLSTAQFASADDIPAIPYESVADLLHLPPDLYLGEVSGVAVNSKGHIFVLHRGNSTGPAYAAAAAQLLEFDADGNYLREIGHHLYAWSFAHTVKIDADDAIWVTDKGSDMVIKFTPEGHVDMVFGRKQEAADEDTGPLKHPNPPLPAHNGFFRQVTDIAWDKAGNTFISDGYINSRVAKLDKNGNWLKSFGEPGSGPGQFQIPHSIGVDDNDNVYVADRSNGRIEVFDTNGKFLRQISFNVPPPEDAQTILGEKPDMSAPPPAVRTQYPNAPWTICITPGPTQYIYTSDSYPGRIYKLTLDGKLVGYLGGAGKSEGKFGWIHEIACPSENELYVAELLNWRVQKLILHPKR